MNRSWKPGAATGAAARAAAQARHALGDDGFAQAWEHLTHIFTKLGITTRAELTVQAAARDLTARRSDRQNSGQVVTAGSGGAPKRFVAFALFSARINVEDMASAEDPEPRGVPDPPRNPDTPR